MHSLTFTILPAPEILKNDVECLRIAEYSGEEGVAIKVSPCGVPGIVFHQNNGRKPDVARDARGGFTQIPMIHVNFPPLSSTSDRP
jgi:hypothetical protein